MVSSVLSKLFDKKDLSIEETQVLFEKIFSGELKDVEIAAILTSLKLKGEVVDEIAGAILAVDRFKIKVKKHKSPAIDTCGTGGDYKNCINVSTAVAILMSAIGEEVVKHGNSAQSGKIGSADILREFNIPCDLHKDEAEKFLQKHNFVFLFAPFYHPAMKYVAPIRKALKTRTIFNFIGPFVNPADPEIQFTGISNLDSMKKIVDALIKAGRKDIVIYSSYDGYDEFSTNAPTECYEIREDYVKKFRINPNDFFKPFQMPFVSDKDDAKSKFLDGISGADKNLAKLISLNSILPIKYIKGLNSFKESFDIAMDAIYSGLVLTKFRELQIVGS